MLKKYMILGIVGGLFALMCAVNTCLADGCIPPPPGLVSWWPGDGNANDIEDGNDGTVYGATYASGKVEQAFSFDGVDDYVDVGDVNAIDGQSAVTYEAWIYRSGGTRWDGIISKKQIQTEPGISLDFLLAGTLGGVDDLFARVGGGSGSNPYGYTTSNLVTPSAWHHVAMVFDGTKSGNANRLKIYVDGQEQPLTFSGTIPATTPLSTGSVTIGKYMDYQGSWLFNGLIDEVEIFDRALSASEIQDICDAGSAGKCKPCVTPPSNMVSWWPGDGNPDDIADGNDGKVYGATFADGKVDQAFRLDGNDYVEVADDTKLNPSLLTVDAWINTTFLPSPYSAHFIVAKSASDGYHGYELGTTTDGKVRFTVLRGAQYPYGDVFGSTVVASGNWHHIAGTYDGSFLRIYIDGALDATKSYTGGIGYIGSSPLYIGKRQYPSIPGFFNGDIDEVEIHDIALSADDILAIYNAGSAGKCKPISVYVDIKPGSCPNPLNTKSQGVLPVAILGTPDFDVAEIDASSVELVGVGPLRWSIEDVATPYLGEEYCDCTEEEGDGYADLTLKFDTQEIVAAFGDVEDGDTPVLTLTANLNDGTCLEGQDCVLIIQRGKGGQAMVVTGPSTPMVFALSQNNPNPFAHETSISYTLPASGHSTLKVYDTSGRLVTKLVDTEMNAGIYTVTWNRKNAASGVYFYRLTNNGNCVTRKMTVLR